ncbi:hypothetical protein FCV25MIE_30136 [Fagus crenata]
MSNLRQVRVKADKDLARGAGELRINPEDYSIYYIGKDSQVRKEMESFFDSQLLSTTADLIRVMKATGKFTGILHSVSQVGAKDTVRLLLKRFQVDHKDLKVELALAKIMDEGTLEKMDADTILPSIASRVMHIRTILRLRDNLPVVKEDGTMKEEEDANEGTGGSGASNEGTDGSGSSDDGSSDDGTGLLNVITDLL